MEATPGKMGGLAYIGNTDNLLLNKLFFLYSEDCIIMAVNTILMVKGKKLGGFFSPVTS